MAALCAALAARSGWRRGVLNLSFAGERERRWRGELRHRLESPGEQLEQARPTLAQGQLAAKHWLEGSKPIFGKYTYFLDPKIHGLLVFVSDLMRDFLLIGKSIPQIIRM